MADTPNILDQPVAGAFSGARAFNSINQSLTSGSLVALSFDSELYDVGGYHEAITHPTRMTVITTGRHHVGALVETTGSPGAGAYTAIRLNGTTLIAWTEIGNDTAAGLASIVTDYSFTAGDYVEVLVKVNAASKNAVAGDLGNCALWIRYLG